MIIDKKSLLLLIVSPWRLRRDYPPHAQRRVCRTARRAADPRSGAACVCHACYDAPCQLKLGAWEGIARGTSKALVYDGAAWTKRRRQRLFVDAQSASQWRSRGFSAVLNEREPDAGGESRGERDVSRAAAQGGAIRCPKRRSCPEAFDFSLDRETAVPADRRVRCISRAKNPLWGMPFGLPGLSPIEWRP
jgi:hypothetical protein